LESEEATMDLRDKGVIVTGASRGLGAELARELAGRGARVVLVARELGPLEDVAQSISACGGEAHAVTGDVADKHATHVIAASAAALIGPVDVLIHNASTLGPTPLKLLLDTECEDFSHVLDVNLVGPFRLSKAVAGSMALRRTGLVVHISSDASVEAYPTWGAYSVSKAAFDHLGRLLAAELSDFGVHVLSIDPGEMRTRMHRDAVPDADESALLAPETVAAQIAGIIAGHDRWPSGARLKAADWEVTS
jgi:NAD(P)-dependent dehydrogenase (short-subunit alcohol dehydrogenase family)